VDAVITVVSNISMEQLSGALDATEDVMTTTVPFANTHHTQFLARASLAAAMLVFAMTSVSSAQQSFKTTEQAADALVSAARIGDLKGILSVLGRGGADIVSSGDEVSDAEARQRFVAAYDAKHQVTMDSDSKAVMVIGQEDFPFPIPLIRKDGMWRFDAAAGRLEILYRHIGRNELDTIQACLAYVDAQNKYARKDRTGAGAGIYAQRIVSQPGKKDGLYWPASQGDGASTFGELVAQAIGDDYHVVHGYYYKVLTKQGPAAPGGARDYVVRGKMIGGFTLVAYPVEYENSGVMTFIVSHEGKVFQKDLGPRTIQLAERMTSFNPDQTWKEVVVPLSPQ
jgi:Protein of unknown function (DUF2950)